MNPAALNAALSGDLANALVASTPGGIERQEKAGQTALVQSTNMPSEMTPDRSTFEAVGFTFGEPVDNLFLSATLPPGWTRAATDHSMHSDILDEHGRKRVSVFYKAAFYDRRANCYMTRRFVVGSVYDEHEQTAVTIEDAGVILKSWPVEAGASYDVRSALRKEVAAQLNAVYPNNGDPLAYWDRPDAAPVAL